MKPWCREYFERILLLLAGAGLLASSVWFWRGEVEIQRRREEPVAIRVTGSQYTPSGPYPTQTAGLPWTLPRAQSSGEGWRYEVFTPPPVYYNASTNSFSVAPKSAPVLRQASADLELLAVKFESYRLQLVGCFGVAGDYLAAFSLPGSSEIKLARTGHRFDQLGISLVGVEQKTIAVEHVGAWPVVEAVTLARLWDDRARSEVILDSRACKLTETLVAVCRFGGADQTSRELHQGDSLSLGASAYRVERIQFNPPEVELVRPAVDLAPAETKILHVSSLSRTGITTGGAVPSATLLPPMAEISQTQN